MAIIRQSPGIYKDTVTGKTYNAKTQADAAKMALNTPASAGNTPKSEPVNLVDQKNGTFKDAKTGKIYKGANIKDAQRAYNAEKIAARTPAPVSPAPAPAPVPNPDLTPERAPKKEDVPDPLGGGKVENPSDLYRADIASEERNLATRVGAANPQDQYDAYGNRKTTDVDEFGNVITREQLGAAEQRLLDQERGLTEQGRGVAQDLLNSYNFEQGFNPELAQRTTGGDLMANRQRVEDAVYAKLTKDVATEQAQETEQAAQTLRNRGIPLGSALYDREMKKLTDRYQGVKDSARQQAIAMGGEEYSRDFGINEQLRANQLSEQQGIRNQQIGEVGQFSQFGYGRNAPAFGQYQGVNYDPNSFADAYGQYTAAQQGQEQNDIAKRQAEAAIAKLNRGSGGGSSQPATNSPFNNTTLPGA